MFSDSMLWNLTASSKLLNMGIQQRPWGSLSRVQPWNQDIATEITQLEITIASLTAQKNWLQLCFGHS